MMDPSPGHEGPQTTQDTVPIDWTSHVGVLVAEAVVLLAALAFWSLPAGSWLRWVLGLLAIMLAPGYLLLEAVLGRAHDLGQQTTRLALALGVSPAVVGLLALATSLWPSGFRPVAIVWALVVVCTLLASFTWLRRIAWPTPSPAKR